MASEILRLPMESTFQFFRNFEKDQPLVPGQQAVSHRASKPHQQGRIGHQIVMTWNTPIKNYVFVEPEFAGKSK